MTEIELAEDGSHRVGSRHGKPAVGHHRNTHGQTHHRGYDDGYKEGSLDTAGYEYTTQHDGQDAQQGLGGKLAKGYKSIGVRHHDTGVLQTDKGDKHADAGRYGVAQVAWYAVQYLLAHIQKGYQDKDDTLDQQGGQRLLP